MLPDSIQLTKNPGEALATFLSKKTYSQILVVTDTNTLHYCYPLLKEHLPKHETLTTPAGEECKNLETCVKLWQRMTELNVDRHAVLIVVGGGVLGDMAGFCAATYKRGIDFILIPTTLLAQVDASIGGKLGIDFNSYKNHIGVFKKPVFTLLYSGFLETISERELLSGFAEVIKHALISDRQLWDEIRGKKLGEQDWPKLLEHSAEFKSSIVEQDPTEKGLRKILNAGHTIGHALESYLLENGRKIMHGEAVAAGLVAEAFLAFQRKLIDLEYLNSITTYIKDVFGTVVFEENELDSIARYSLQDKKNKNNEILCVLLHAEGIAGWDYAISLQDVKGALSFYLSH